MKILLDARMIGPQMHGIARYTLTLAKLLKASGAEVTLLIAKNEIPNFEKNRNLDWLASDVTFASPMEPFFLMKHWQDFRRFDVVHFTSFAIPIVPPKHSIATIHDLIHMSNGSALKNIYYKIFVRFSLTFVSKVIAVSQFTKKELVQKLHLKKEKISVVGNFLDEDWYQADANPFFHERPYFLAVANPKPHKNLKTLVQSCKRLWQQGLDFDLFFVGDKIESLEQENSNPRIRYFSKITDSELRAIYKGAKAFVSPSEMEGFNIPVLEAISQNCPVILSNAEAHLEFRSPLLKFYGPPKETAALTEALRAELEPSRGRIELSDAKENKTTEEVSAAMRQLYKEVSSLD